jgi:hypothetical protein
MRVVRSLWGQSAFGRRLAGFAASLLCVCGLGLWQPLADGAAATATCPGRPALPCSLRTALYYDGANWAIGGFGSLDLFQAKRALHLGNPALAGFWRYEAATGMARYQYDLAIGSPGRDLAFESPVQTPRPPAPVIKATGIVTRHMASVMRSLLKAEQQEVGTLVAMDTALDRAAGAVSRGRSDWAKYLAYVSAGFARQAADAIGVVIPRQRAVTKALIHAKLPFGVGPADQRAAQRYVRSHGFPPALQQIMLQVGMNSVTVSLAKYGFLHAKPNATTYSMSRYLSLAKVIRYEQNLASELRSFAGSVPAVSQPPN